MNYASPGAFRRALLDRVRGLGGSDPDRLHKRIAMERLLARLQREPQRAWILKGGVALELRMRESARATKDLDLGVELEFDRPITAAAGDVLELLQQAAEQPLDDFFEFRVSRGPAVPRGGTQALSFQVTPLVDGERFGAFKVDVGAEPLVASVSDEVSGSGYLEFAGVSRERFQVISISRHFAEKIHAYSRPREENTRPKDLVDLLLLADLGLPTASLVRADVESVFAAVDSHPIPLTLPDPPENWDGPISELAAATGLGPLSLVQAAARITKLWKELGYEEKQ